MFPRFYSLASVIRLCIVLTVAVCLACFCYAIGGQHIYTAAMQHHKEMEKKDLPLPTWTKEFEAFEIKCGTPLPIRRKLAGLQQVQTTSSSVSTTTECMQLFLEHFGEAQVARRSPMFKICLRKWE